MAPEKFRGCFHGFWKTPRRKVSIKAADRLPNLHSYRTIHALRLRGRGLSRAKAPIVPSLTISLGHAFFISPPEMHTLVVT